MAANNEALRHYGQKVVYGHVTTNSGRRVLIQITFDVMSVRKPLLSTSAMKRRWVTIIFNHDYDRIIFQNETANWISHDCHAYLCLTLANRIPHRKAMVMVGENVSTKKSTLVMVAWDMKHTASAGERRAIADADQAGQHDISGETRAAKALRTPEPPTDAAQEVKLLRRQLEELNARMEEIRQQSASAAMDAAVTGLTDAVTTMGQSVTRPRPGDMRVGKPEPYMPGKDSDDWGFTFNGYAGTLDPAYPALLKAARQSTTVGLTRELTKPLSDS